MQHDTYKLRRQPAMSDGHDKRRAYVKYYMLNEYEGCGRKAKTNTSSKKGREK